MWGSPRLGGLPLQFAASCRGFQLQGSPRAPQEIKAPKCAPQQGGGGVSRLPPPISEGLGPPSRRPAPAQTVRAPAGEGKLRPGQPFPSTEPDSTIQRAISQWQKKGTCREKGRGQPGRRSRPRTARPVLPQLLPAGTPIPHQRRPSSHIQTLLAGTRQGPAAPSRPSAGSRARSPVPKASSRAKQEKLTLFSFPLPPVLQLPAPGPAAREGRAHCPHSPG